MRMHTYNVQNTFYLMVLLVAPNFFDSPSHVDSVSVLLLPQLRFHIIGSLKMSSMNFSVSIVADILIVCTYECVRLCVCMQVL